MLMLDSFLRLASGRTLFAAPGSGVKYSKKEEVEEKPWKKELLCFRKIKDNAIDMVAFLSKVQPFLAGC